MAPHSNQHMLGAIYHTPPSTSLEGSAEEHDTSTSAVETSSSGMPKEAVCRATSQAFSLPGLETNTVARTQTYVQFEQGYDPSVRPQTGPIGYF